MKPSAELVQNALLMRQKWLQKLLDPRKDIDQECGHPFAVTIEDYKRAFQRGDLASRVVTLFPDETWCGDPDIFETEDDNETEFEAVWIALQDKRRLYSLLHRVDVLSGVGRFGILLLGIDDGLDLGFPVASINERGEVVGSPKHQLLYVRPFDESLVTVKRLELDITNPRYGLPLEYEIQFSDTTLGETATTARTVHWSRVIHIADNRANSEIYGAPRMEKVFDRLLDLKKVAGGSGEMFWKGGFPGIALEMTPDAGENIEFDKEATQEQMESYMNGLQRYIALIGLSAKSLNVQVADPGPHIEAQIRLIAMAISVPWRILMGVETGQLASEQDIRNWNKRVQRRRDEYVNPYIIRPFIDRLIAYGVLPEVESYQIFWEDLNSPSDGDKAGVAEKRTNALAKYVQGGVSTLIPPFHYLTLVLDFSDEEANSIIKAAGGELLALELPEEEEPNVGNNRTIGNQ